MHSGFQKRIKLCGGKYIYSRDHNFVINNQIKNLFSKYGNNLIQKAEDFSINEDLPAIRIKKIERILFELTQNCNLTCKYCLYRNSSCFRKPSNVNLDLHLAKRAIDYVYNLIKDREDRKFLVGLYGGEPLLNFRTLKAIVEYSKAMFSHWDIRFNMTTNGTLLTDDIIDYLISNDFSILVSLDGPKQVHDAKRVFSNGDGTFDIICKNLNKIAKRNINYYINRVGFSISWARDLSILKIHEFYSKNNMVNKNRMVFSIVDEPSYYEKYPYSRDCNKNEISLLKKIINLKSKDGINLNNFENTISAKLGLKDLDSVIEDLRERKFDIKRGACLFDNMVYVDAGGYFHPCHLVGSKYIIGDVWRGFDFKKMIYLAKQFRSTVRKSCIKCTVRAFCNPCFVTFSQSDNFGIDETACHSIRTGAIKNLEEAIQYREQRSNGLKSKKNVVTKDFHQFIYIEKGYRKSAIIDFLKRNIYHVDNEIIRDFKMARYGKVLEFIQFAQNEDLLIDVKEKIWIPHLDFGNQNPTRFNTINEGRIRYRFLVETEQGVNFRMLREWFADYEVYKLVFYGKKIDEECFPNVIIERREKAFKDCQKKLKIGRRFNEFNCTTYEFNMNYNPCWGGKIAVTKQGEIRPCIYSKLVMGNIFNDSIEKIFPDLLKYWSITKDKINKCKHCEFRFLCFDCREIAYRKYNNLYETNPYCTYDPLSGEWGIPDS